MAEQQGKVLILTGASRGIGLSIAHTLLSSPSSHKLVVISRTHASLDQLHYQYPSQVEVLAGDLSDFSLGAKAVDIAISRWGQLDGVVINHGTLEPVKKVADADIEEWRKGFDVNVFSGLGVIKPAIPHLRTTQGTIILISSGASVSAYQGWGPYGAAKAVLNHLALTLSVEEPDITTISIRPGVVDTEMQREIREVHAQSMSEKDRLKFKGLKEEGGLLKPEQPGGVVGRLVGSDLKGKGLSGKFLNWNAEELGEWQGE